MRSPAIPRSKVVYESVAMAIHEDLRLLFAVRLNPITTEATNGTATICKSK
jgi:hypothetical protein